VTTLIFPASSNRSLAALRARLVAFPGLRQIGELGRSERRALVGAHLAPLASEAMQQHQEQIIVLCEVADEVIE
jgi:hypothetical protein